MKLTAIELFAGIGGFRLAADRAGLNTVWANEIEPKACSVYRSRFGTEALIEGDIRQCKQSIPSHDLLTGGFPCQPFSSAGKKEGTRDPRGTLFQEIVETLQRHRPKFFVLENVKRLLSMESGSHFATILESLASLDYQVEWRLINAANFGLAQNRERVVIVGVRADSVGSDALSVRLAPLADLSVLGPRAIEKIRRKKDWAQINPRGAYPTWGIASSGRFIGGDLPRFSERLPPVMLKDVLLRSVGDEFDFTESTIQRLQASEAVNKFVHGVQILSNQSGGARMGYTVFGIDGLAPTLTATTSRHYERYKIGNRYRRLTNEEYAILQGFSANHANKVSVYDQYSLYGNAVPPPLAEWAIKKVLSGGVAISEVSSGTKQTEMWRMAWEKMRIKAIRAKSCSP